MHWQIFHLILGIACVVGSYQNFTAERFTNAELALGIVLGLIGFGAVLLALFPIPHGGLYD